MTNDSTHRKKDQGDVSDSLITLKVKHVWTVVTTVVGVTAMLGMGWFELKAEAAEAKRGVETLTNRVARIECLVQQANEYQMYKRLPAYPCV